MTEPTAVGGHVGDEVEVCELGKPQPVMGVVTEVRYPMDDLIAFLRARLGEREQTARVAEESNSSPWRNETYRDNTGYCEGKIKDADRYTVVHVEDQTPDPATAEHIAANDPAWVLADVASKRALIDEILRYEEKIDGEWGCCHSAEAIAAGKCSERRPDQIPAFRAMALPYAGHPDYREEWRV